MFLRWTAVWLLPVLLLCAGCRSTQPYTLEPIKTFDPDNKPVPPPDDLVENMYWDRVDLSVFHQLEKPFNLNWTGRKVGQWIGVAEPREADNVNALDEVPNSSWYTRRHYYDPMTPEELAKGPNGTPAGPDMAQPWTITSGKFEGAGRGFVIEDGRGDRFLIKLDGPRWPGLTSSAEVISTKIFHAAGYYVPENTIVHFDPAALTIADDAEVSVGAGRRPMIRSDIEEMLEPYPRRDDGTIRALASKYVDGRPYGPWNFVGTRKDDPNDRVLHEHRRELRGLSVLGAWLNDADRRAANTLAVYTDEKYVKHYLIDMGSTLGANASGVHRPIHGEAYLIDPRYMTAALFSFGLFERRWADYEHTTPYPSVGYYRADIFKPNLWVPTYPNPAFQKTTRRDGFWGAKIVMSFTDEDLEAIIETAQMPDPEAEAYLLRVLKERRDKVGRYWFARVNPIDKFRVERGASADMASRQSGRAVGAEPGHVLYFEDLAVAGGLADAAISAYRYSIYHDKTLLQQEQMASEPVLPLRINGEALSRVLDRRGADRSTERVVRVDIQTRRGDESYSPTTRVYVFLPADAPARIVGLERL